MTQTMHCPRCGSDDCECTSKPTHMHRCLSCGYDGTTVIEPATPYEIHGRGHREVRFTEDFDINWPRTLERGTHVAVPMAEYTRLMYRRQMERERAPRQERGARADREVNLPNQLSDDHYASLVEACPPVEEWRHPITGHGGDCGCFSCSGER